MTAQPAHKVLTPKDLLALVRQSSDRFQRLEGALASGEKTAAFVSRRYVANVEKEELEAPPKASPEPVEVPSPESSVDEPEVEGFTASPAAPSIDLEAEKQTAWQAGFDAAAAQFAAELDQKLDAAREEARTAAAAETAEAQATFAAIIQRLCTAEEDLMTNLETQMATAIRSLAADRAGQRIDEAPKPFQRRIEKLVREIAAGIESTVIQMNPADLMAIRPHIKSFSPLADARLSPDPKLGRGDVRLKMDTISFSDCIAEGAGRGLS